MATKTQWGFRVQGWTNTNGTGTTYDIRLDWRIQVGQIMRNGRAADQLDLSYSADLNFIAFGYNAANYERETRGGGYGLSLQPGALPREWGQFGADQRSKYVYIDCLEPRIEMRAHMNEDSAKTLAFIGRILDYPDSKMSYAASDRFDGIREAWYSMDNFARALWTLRERGAINLSPNQFNDCYLRPADAASQPTTERMLSWLFMSNRHANSVRQSAVNMAANAALQDA